MLLIENFLLLFTESAPYLLIGMGIAGVIHQLVPRVWVEKTLGQKSSVITAALIGAPLPLCSCSVIPVAMGVRRSGASKASTASFLVATPETGVDSIGITYALMGPVMAIARPIAAITSAVVAGLSIKLLDSSSSQPSTAAPVKSCCKTKQVQALGWQHSLKAAMQYGYGQLLKDFMKWLLIGIAMAAIIKTFVPPELFTQYGQGVLAMTLVVIISIPMYICATASTPIAVGLMLSGISPGAALVFMLTGPATNIATLMVVKNELGIRALGLYLLSVIGTAILCGLSFDWIINEFGLSLALAHGHHDDMTSLLYQCSAFLLAALMLFQFFKTQGSFFWQAKDK